MTFRYGDPCRVHTAPARYLTDGVGMYISCMDNDLMIGVAEPPKGNEAEFPLPSQDMLDAAMTMRWWMRHRADKEVPALDSPAQGAPKP